MAGVTFGTQNTQKTFSTSSPAATVSGLPNQAVPASGAQPPAPTAFGGFGAPVPTPGTGGLFGSSNPAPAPFGSSSPAPSMGAFGSSTPAPAPFGSPAPSAGGGLFGSSTPAPASGGGLFGGSSSSTFGSNFSSQGTSLFGTRNNPAPSSGGGLFGTTSTSSSSLFGQQPQPAQQPGYPQQAYEAMTWLYNAEDRQFQEEANSLLTEFALVYSQRMAAPSRTESAPFTATLYNPASANYQQQVWLTVGNSGNPDAKPLIPAQATQVSANDWALACANAPKDYEPTTCLGADGLVNRISAQQVEAQTLSSQVSNLLKVIETLKERQESALRQGHGVKLHRLRTDRRGRLWRIMQKLEFCRAYQQPLTEEEHAASQHLDRLLKETKAASSVQLPPTSAAVPQDFPRFVTPNGEHPIDPAIIRAQLVEHRQLLVELIHSVKKDLRDVKLLAERFQN